jgi:hypothetical protein
VWRAGLTVAIAGVAVLAFPFAAPAAGGPPVGAPATNYLSRLRAVEPARPGVEVAVLEFGNRLQVVNRTGTEVLVYGYENEPYLSIGPNGVFENRRSPASYLNRNRRGTVPVPASADATAPPDWRRVSSGSVARWYDHRVHWMGAIDPPAVRQRPGERHVVVPEWVVAFRHGDIPFTATGRLTWEPPPSPWPWVTLAAVPLGAAVLWLGAARWVGSRSWWPRGLAAGVALLVVVSLGASLGRAWASPGTATDRLAEVVVANPVLTAAWLVGAVSVLLLARRRCSGLYLAALAAVVIGALGGALAGEDLARSQVPSALPTGVARAAVACSIGLGAAVLLVTIVSARRVPGARATR